LVGKKIVRFALLWSSTLNSALFDPIKTRRQIFVPIISAALCIRCITHRCLPYQTLNNTRDYSGDGRLKIKNKDNSIAIIQQKAMLLFPQIYYSSDQMAVILLSPHHL
jgi:hypothetical protein